MKKIITGILGLMLTVAVAGGSAYALFSSQATVSGVTISTGNASLLVWDGDSYETSFNAGASFSNLYPGYLSGPTTVWFKNASTANVALLLAGKLTTAVTWPDPLIYAAQVQFVDAVTPANTTDWKSLNQWNTSEVALPSGSLGQGSERKYLMYVRVPQVYGDGPTAPTGLVGNEVAGQTVTNATFTFTGTQE